jgi:hypothetical protein
MRHRRNSPAVTRNEEHRICLNSGQTQVDDSFRLPLGFKGIEVAGQARKIVTNTHRYTVGRAVDRMSAKRTVGRTLGETNQTQYVDEVRKCTWCLWEVVPVFVEFEVAVPHLRPAGW